MNGLLSTEYHRVLSFCLFNIYIDDVLNQLSHSGDGAKIANMYVGCMAYMQMI